MRRRHSGQKRFFSTPLGTLSVVALFALLAVLAAWLDPAPPPVSGLARASDGDSFRLADQRVRLLGLDAPELRQSCTDATGKGWPCGQAARDRLSQLLASGSVTCEPEDRDQYQRLLAHCMVGGVDLGATMVGAGLAISDSGYWAQEQAARAARRGIWAGDFEAPKTWRDDHPRGQRAFGILSWFGL